MQPKKKTTRWLFRQKHLTSLGFHRWFNWCFVSGVKRCTNVSLQARNLCIKMVGFFFSFWNDSNNAVKLIFSFFYDLSWTNLAPTFYKVCPYLIVYFKCTDTLFLEIPTALASSCTFERRWCRIMLVLCFGFHSSGSTSRHIQRRLISAISWQF